MFSLLSFLKALVIEVVETIVVALAILAVVYLLAFQPHEVSGESMNGIGSFHDGQYILTDKITYKLREPRRGEVVVFKYPLNTSYDYIKRVIGLPGETIRIQDNQVIIINDENPNGFILEENEYLASEVPTTGRSFAEENEEIKIPEGHYFVMGDNRPESSDSRTWGFVPENDIIGKSFFRYWPPNEAGLIHNPQYTN